MRSPFTSHLAPFALPIMFFGLTIMAGSIALQHPASIAGKDLSWLDALFTATSATCVTGLIVVDTGAFFTQFGQSVIMLLIQLGGLGIMTYTSLIFYLWHKRISLTDRLAVGQALLQDPSFRLGRFLIQVVMACIFIEGIGFLLLYMAVPDFDLFAALFHAVSAFCNAGFALQADNLMAYQGMWTVNLIFIALIVLGGLGFSILIELYMSGKKLVTKHGVTGLTWHTKVILYTSFWLILGGAVLIFFFEGQVQDLGTGELGLTALFQSVTARTAGFNTLAIEKMSSVSLLVIILLMFIGGSPGSCAGGVKTTTLRALLGFILSSIRGRRQTVVAGMALNRESINKALTLTIFALGIILAAILILTYTEGAHLPHSQARELFLEIVFEVISAFGTAGLSAGVTAKLSEPGKVVIIVLMFIGRLGPILFLSVLQSCQKAEHFSWPESNILIG